MYVLTEHDVFAHGPQLDAEGGDGREAGQRRLGRVEVGRIVDLTGRPHALEGGVGHTRTTPFALQGRSE